MRTITTAVCAATLALACGPGEPGTITGDASTANATTGGATTVDPTTVDPTTTDPTTADPVTTGAVLTTGSDTSTTGEPTSTGAVSTTTGDGTTTSTSTTGDTTTLAETTAGEPLTTKAWFVDGDKVQVRIFQADPATDLCTVVLLDLLNGPGSDNNKYAAVARPEGWGISGVGVYQDIDLCFDPYLWYRNPVAYADSAAGEIVFHDVDNAKPATLDIDITGVYAGDDPWVPAEVPTVADAVPVEVG